MNNLKHTFNQSLIYAIQQITKGLDHSLKNTKSSPHSIETLREAISDAEDNQWKDTCLLTYLPTDTDILNPTAAYFKIPIQDLQILIHPKNIFQISKIIGIPNLTEITNTLPNLIEQFHSTSQTTPSTSRCLQPINTLIASQLTISSANIRQHIIGNSRALLYTQVDPELSAEGESGANLDKLARNIHNLELESNITYLIYVVDAVNDILEKRRNENGFLEVFPNHKITSEDIITKITHIKLNAPPKVILIFATTVQPDIHRYNKKKTHRYNKPFPQIHKNNQEIKRIIDETNEQIEAVNQPYVTPKLHKYCSTTDGLHPDFPAVDRIIEEFSHIQKRNKDILLAQINK